MQRTTHLAVALLVVLYAFGVDANPSQERNMRRSILTSTGASTTIAATAATSQCSPFSGAPVGSPVAFTHVWKCAGTTLDTILVRNATANWKQEVHVLNYNTSPGHQQLERLLQRKRRKRRRSKHHEVEDEDMDVLQEAEERRSRSLLRSKVGYSGNLLLGHTTYAQAVLWHSNVTLVTSLREVTMKRLLTFRYWLHLR